MIRKVYRSLIRNLNSIRTGWYTWVIKTQAKSVGTNLTVNHKSHVTENTILGNNVNFNGMCIQGHGDVMIGDNFHSGEDILIITQNHNYEGEKIPYDESNILKPVTINDNVWIGTRVTILGGVVIGEGAIIQAGSTVVSDIPDCAIAGGHPAKVFAYRNKEHYYDLKKKEQYH